MPGSLTNSFTSPPCLPLCKGLPIRAVRPSFGQEYHPCRYCLGARPHSFLVGATCWPILARASLELPAPRAARAQTPARRSSRRPWATASASTQRRSSNLARQLSRKPFVPPPERLAGRRSRTSTTISTSRSGQRPPDLGQRWARHRRRTAPPRVRLHQRGRSLSRRGRHRAARRATTARNSITASSIVPPNLGDVGFSGFRLLAIRQRKADRLRHRAGRHLFPGPRPRPEFRRRRPRPHPEAGGSQRRGISRSSGPSGSSGRPPAATASRSTGSSIRNRRSGAVRMTFRPGDMTIVDVETSLFPRVNLEHVGLGGMTSTYLLRPQRPAQRRRRSPGRLRIVRPADAQRPGRMALASAAEPGNAADFGLRRSPRRGASACCSATAPSRRFRTTSSASSGARASGSSLWAIGARAACSSSKSRPTPRSTTTSSPIGGRKPPMAAGFRSGVRLSAVLVLGAAGAAAPGDRARQPGSAAARGGRRRRFVVDFTGDMLGEIAPADLKPVLTVGPGSYPESEALALS